MRFGIIEEMFPMYFNQRVAGFFVNSYTLIPKTPLRPALYPRDGNFYDLNTMDFLPYGEALLTFMDRYLEFNCGLCLQTFKMKYCRHKELENESSVRPSLDIMPGCIYLSKTLVSLKLVRVGLKNLNYAVSLPCLKIMHLEGNYIMSRDTFYCIDYVRGDGRLVMENLISGSPVLENVTLRRSSSWTNVPQCLSSTLEYVMIDVDIMMSEDGIKLANYFLENSAVLKKLTLSYKYFCKAKREPERYKKLLTSTKLSPRCKILVH
ncbi:hypothetical protein Bca4012_043045 [Brassica carinata]|nr:hypothetical protein HID58_086287 [Brassica napus]CAF1732700.1 unnamed protein product [Brassica napus]